MSKLVREKLDEQFKKGKDPFDKYKIGKKELLKRKYSVDNIDEVLTKASSEGNLEDVKMAIKKNADVHVYHDLSLCLAAQNDHLDVVKYLVEQGADIDEALALDIAHDDVMDYLEMKKEEEDNG